MISWVKNAEGASYKAAQSRVGPGRGGVLPDLPRGKPPPESEEGQPRGHCSWMTVGRVRENGALPCTVLTWELGTAPAKGASLPLPPHPEPGGLLWVSL